MFVWKHISGIAWRQLNNVLIKHKKICTNNGLNDCNVDDYAIIKSKYVKVDIHFKESERNWLSKDISNSVKFRCQRNEIWN